jgi:hypothetical protein
MLRHTLHQKLVSASLAIVISGVAAPIWATTGTSTLTGRVLAAGSGAPLEGWTVLVGNPTSRTVASTVTTKADGSFEVSGLAPATYELAVRNDAKVFTVNGAVQLAPGQARSVQLAVNQEQIAPPPNADDPNSNKGATTWWSNPLVATLLVVGGAVLIGVIVDNASDDDQQSASPSNP